MCNVVILATALLLWLQAARVEGQTPVRLSLVPSQQTLDDELAHVNAELAKLHQKRPRHFWLTAGLTAGGAVGVIVGASNFALWSASLRRRYGWDEQGNRYKYLEREDGASDFARVAVIASAIGVVALAAGLKLFIPRARQRRELARESRPLRQRRRWLIEQMRLAINVEREQRGVHLRVQF